MWLLLILLQAAVLPAQLCEAPGEAAAVRVLSARLLGLAGDPARDPDPSVYLALRLASDHDLRGEERYLARLRDAFQHRYGRSLQAAGQLHGHPQWDTTTTEHDTNAEAEWPETGRLALYLLGLRATCPLPEPGPQRLLVTWLKYYLEEDWAGSRRHGQPLTSYYQYSLGVLALCVHRKRVREEVIHRLLAAEHHGRFRHTGGSAVDTEAVAVLAFTCLERERLVGSRLAAELQAARHRVRRRMVEAQDPAGFFGNVYSTPWAMQVGVTGRWPAWWGMGAGVGADMGAWAEAAAAGQGLGRQVMVTTTTSVVAMAQGPNLPPASGTAPPPSSLPLPGFHRHQHVPDTAGIRPGHGCAAGEPGRLHHRRHHGPGAAGAAWPLLPGHRLHALPGGAGFVTQDTPQGPFLSRVLGMEARQQQRRYWQLLSAPGTSLQMGIADYRPHDGETLILRLSEW
ncbi:transcobalamin-2 isoform 1-T1 [Alca torda]